MANMKDIVLFASILIGSGLVIVSFAGVSLPGTGSNNYVCSIPILQDLSLCQKISPEDKYNLKVEAKVSRLNIHYRYKTTEEQGAVFSSLGDLLAFPAETRNTKVQWVLRNNKGLVVASETQRFGTISGGEYKKTVFEVGNLDDGTYTLEATLTGQECGPLEAIIGCPLKVEKHFEHEIKIPRLPLGEYTSFKIGTR